MKRYHAKNNIAGCVRKRKRAIVPKEVLNIIVVVFVLFDPVGVGFNTNKLFRVAGASGVVLLEVRQDVAVSTANVCDENGRGRGNRRGRGRGSGRRGEEGRADTGEVGEKFAGDKVLTVRVGLEGV